MREFGVVFLHLFNVVNSCLPSRRDQKIRHGAVPKVRHRILSFTILDQAPLWLLATCVNSLWLVNIHDGSRAGSLSLTIATCLRVSPIEFGGGASFPPASRIALN